MPDRESCSVSRRESILAIGQVNLQRSDNRISQALGQGNAFSWQCFSSIHQVRASLSALYRLHGVANDSAQHPGGKKRRSSLSASQLVQTQHGLHGIPSPKGIRVGGDSFVVGCVSNVCEALSSTHSTKKKKWHNQCSYSRDHQLALQARVYGAYSVHRITIIHKYSSCEQTNYIVKEAKIITCIKSFDLVF